MERLGLALADCAVRNPKLVYGRITGWGQSGPLAQATGHDLNYVAPTGLLSLSTHPGERPTVLGDAGGALGLAFGIACALIDARTSGRGRVVDGAIVDVVAMLDSIAQWVRGGGQIDGPEPSPFHDSPFYDVYACADGGSITVAALEPRFYALLLCKLGLSDVSPAQQYDKAAWPALKARFALQVPAPCPLVRIARRQRRLLRAGAEHGRSSSAPAQRRARHLPPGWRYQRPGRGRGAALSARCQRAERSSSPRPMHGA